MSKTEKSEAEREVELFEARERTPPGVACARAAQALRNHLGDSLVGNDVSTIEVSVGEYGRDRIGELSFEVTFDSLGCEFFWEQIRRDGMFGQDMTDYQVTIDKSAEPPTTTIMFTSKLTGIGEGLCYGKVESSQDHD